MLIPPVKPQVYHCCSSVRLEINLPIFQIVMLFDIFPYDWFFSRILSEPFQKAQDIVSITSLLSAT